MAFLGLPKTTRSALALMVGVTASSASLAAEGRSERSFEAYVTGYSYWDNTPPGSTAISKPVVHASAGGSGTYEDPITIAVGHAIRGGRQFLDYPPGTRFYIASLRKYAIVEDVCGDGPTPQNGPCHSGHRGLPWLDIYVDGAQGGRSAAADCASRITAVHLLIENPAPDYPVVAGAISETGCRRYQ
ncbi:MAG: hypothetical protein KDJ88_15925 [Bauldia sp.]|nr:hypothetical protein [Bauldia sp.]